jgi:hypothetical protein
MTKPITGYSFEELAAASQRLASVGVSIPFPKDTHAGCQHLQDVKELDAVIRGEEELAAFAASWRANRRNARCVVVPIHPSSLPHPQPWSVQEWHRRCQQSAERSRQKHQASRHPWPEPGQWAYSLVLAAVLIVIAFAILFAFGVATT